MLGVREAPPGLRTGKKTLVDGPAKRRYGGLMKPHTPRKAQTSTSLEALDNAFLQGVVQIIDTSLAQGTQDKDFVGIVTYLRERGLFDYRELADLSGSDYGTVRRWIKGVNGAERDTAERCLRAARTQLARWVLDGRD